ncbi:lactonase family protein [Hymenobacter psychrophilus]|uniref:6-phosphogluconolactonase n=1 Tax=Hymenobacter psychrophilus TaxID=651662 RepID=A0A1H3LKJ9_9BACT|nr:lactonase family protein [Hymenobacter psychrophilus]SDY64375.1 6-phosphogluconolactonase [Hymenobacter psychrophilus]
MRLTGFSRRRFLQLVALALAGLPLLGGCGAGHLPASARPDYLVYVGTYAEAEAESIFLYRLGSDGALTRLRAEKAGANPSFIALDARHRYLYAANEVGQFEGAASGFVSAYAIDQRTGQLTPQGRQASGGADPCYLSLSPDNQAVLVANYSGGSVALLPLASDGQLKAAATTNAHQGSGPNRERQEKPHAHCIIPDPAGRFAFAVDLGIDQVVGYRLDAARGQLEPLAAPAFTTQPGAGPRHLTFHPNGRWAYLANELTSTVTALRYDTTAGRFDEVNTLSALPAGFSVPNTAADIHVAPSGRFVYSSNRGHNSLAVFSVAAEDGRLILLQTVSTQGQTPRNFALSPDGRLLVVANQSSNSLVTFRVDAQTGLLTPTGHTATVPKPVSLQVLPDFMAR